MSSFIKKLYAFLDRGLPYEKKILEEYFHQTTCVNILLFLYEREKCPQ